jgi:hypothetical protein
MNLNRIKIQLTCSRSAAAATGHPPTGHPPHHHPRTMTTPTPREPPRGSRAPRE